MARTSPPTGAVPGPTDPSLTIRRADPSEPDIRALLAAHLAHSRAHSPEQSCHVLGADEMSGVALYAVCEGPRVLGCGGLKPLGDGTAEVKSVHVAAAYRGRGLSRQLMAALIAAARAQGLSALVLETGSEAITGFDAARRLYSGLGFRPCGPIPGYVPDEASAFYRLDLAGGGSGQGRPELAG